MTEHHPLETFASIEDARAEVERLRRKAVKDGHTVLAARREQRRLEGELNDAIALLGQFGGETAADVVVPKWLTPKTKRRDHRAMPVLLISDLHLDEVVNRDEMQGVNEYDRMIAEQRWEAIINGTVKMLKRFVAGVGFDGIFLSWLGDILTGVIHDELARTNAAPVPASIVHWVPLLVAGIKHLADEFDVPVHNAVVDGNHDRFYKQTPMKQRAESSFAWVIYNWMAEACKDDDRITFSITPAAEQLVPVYDTRFLLSHGDSFRSAGGVGGLYPSMLKWLLRRHDFYSQTQDDFDYALIGHWHQPLWGQDFVVNGSLKGYDEYAKHNGFKFNAPSQQLFVVTPERGLTQRLEVFAQ